MSTTITLPGGKVHELPDDLAAALTSNDTAKAAWLDITVLARNEFICWVNDTKQQKTREQRIRRTVEELSEGKRRPCCWPGCPHRERNGNRRDTASRGRRAVPRGQRVTAKKGPRSRPRKAQKEEP